MEIHALLMAVSCSLRQGMCEELREGRRTDTGVTPSITLARNRTTLRTIDRGYNSVRVSMGVRDLELQCALVLLWWAAKGD
jgi:hypothetical protein